MPVASDSCEAQLAATLHPVLCAAFVATGRLRATDVTVEEAAVLLATEAANGFCVMARPDAGDARRVRGTGVYLQSSRINHGEQALDCSTKLRTRVMLRVPWRLNARFVFACCSMLSQRRTL
jgi:hypothetical protein